MERRMPSHNAEPNVIPMIDIMLVLLIIFMLGVMLVRKTMDLQLPQRTPGTGGPPIVLKVGMGPSYSLNGQPVPATDLVPRLRAVFEPRPEKVIFVDGDRGLRYQQVMDAFDAVRGAGVRVTGVVLH